MLYYLLWHVGSNLAEDQNTNILGLINHESSALLSLFNLQSSKWHFLPLIPFLLQPSFLHKDLQNTFAEK